MAFSRASVPTLVGAGLLGVGVAVAGVLTASGALAVGETGTPTAPPSSSSAAPSAPDAPGTQSAPGAPRTAPDGPRLRMRGHGGGPFGGPGRGAGVGLGAALHGEFVAPKAGGGTETLLVQRGKVTASSKTSLSVESTDGYTLTWTIADATVIRSGRTGATTQDLAVGDQVVVLGPKAGSGGTARFVGERFEGRGQGSGATEDSSVEGSSTST